MTIDELFPQYVTTSMLNDTYDVVSNKIEYCIIHGSLFKEEKRELLTKLYQWKAQQQILELNRSTNQQDRINKILEIPGLVCDDFYIYGGEIPIKGYILNKEFGTDQRIMSVFNRYDIGIKNFKLLKTDVILNIWCTGRHLNVNPEDSTFCYEPRIVPLTNMTVSKLMELMAIVNLDDYYRMSDVNEKVYKDVQYIVKQTQGR